MATEDTVRCRLLVAHTGIGKAGDVVDMPRAQFDGNSKLGLVTAGDALSGGFETAEQDDSTLETATKPAPKKKTVAKKKPS